MLHETDFNSIRDEKQITVVLFMQISAVGFYFFNLPTLISFKNIKKSSKTISLLDVNLKRQYFNFVDFCGLKKCLVPNRSK